MHGHSFTFSKSFRKLRHKALKTRNVRRNMPVWDRMRKKCQSGSICKQSFILKSKLFSLFVFQHRDECCDPIVLESEYLIF